ncbi:hypothetical protein LCGC14_1617280 [marine sediment metagenome]|uniref:SF4 helicase domain-containing protein n=1 Tax=marine sediment metagenome TaxID=412755 RepID=A0A0F9I6U2_9ZZZZ
MRKIKETMSEVIEAIKNPIVGLPTGLESVDKATGGYKPGQLIIIAGRSSMGKTALLGDCVLAQTGKTLFFSLEMSSVVLIQRLIANMANINFRTLINNEADEVQRARLPAVIERLKRRNILIDDTPCLTPDQFWEKAEEHEDADLIIIDHLHLMRHDNGRLGEVQALDDICQQLRTYAKTKNVPIVLACQLNRKTEDRQTHEPRLADLRGSGGIEQDSDIVLLLYRPSYYLQREIDYNTEDDGEAEIILAKHRNGITGKIKTLFIGEYMSFRDNPDETMKDWR